MYDNDEYCEYTKAELKVPNSRGNVKVILSRYRRKSNNFNLASVSS